MALDAERNWTVAMNRSTNILSMNKPRKTTSIEVQVSNGNDASYALSNLKISTSEQDGVKPKKHSKDLPPEILFQIMAYLPQSIASQTTFHACSLVSRAWYAAAVGFLYDYPEISGKNYDLFVRTVCPSINAHIRMNGLSTLVRALDMSQLVHNGSKSLTARLLRRVSRGLEVFVAPQASFGINCLAALSKCAILRQLDLSLVSESLGLDDLFRSIRSLERLEYLHFPRSSAHDIKIDTKLLCWPPKLRELHIAGGLRDDSMFYFAHVPQSLTRLFIGDCPNISMTFISPLLDLLGPQLQKLSINARLPRLHDYSLDHILGSLPILRHLTIAVDYITNQFFLQCFGYSQLDPHPLEQIDFGFVDFGIPSESQLLDRDDVWDAVADGILGRLRKVRVHRKLGWADPEKRKELQELSDLLLALAREDRKGNEALGDPDAGVWVYDG